MTRRSTFIAGNWKMNTDRRSGVDLARALVGQLGDLGAVRVAVCPPAVYLAAVQEVVKETPLALGAQDMYFEDAGAFTGEVSCAMLRDVGCEYVIVGHSERRHVMGEGDETVNRKLHAALAGNLKPILCVGETEGQRNDGRTRDVVRGQLRGGLVGLPIEQLGQVTIAYEPVWAIGTGNTASPEQAEEVHADIRGYLTDTYGADLAETITLQYGGSVKADNAAGLLSQPNIDGALVGGASLKPDQFVAIVHAAKA